MKNNLRFLFLIVFFSNPVVAGKVVTDYHPNGFIAATLDRRPDSDWLVGIINPVTGKYRADRLELRVSGVPVMFFERPPYTFEIDLSQPLASLPTKGFEGQVLIFRPGLTYNLEAFFTTRDRSGRIKMEKSAAVAFEFTVGLVEDQQAAQVAQAIDQAISLINQENERLIQEHQTSLVESAQKQAELEQALEQANNELKRQAQSQKDQHDTLIKGLNDKIDQLSRELEQVRKINKNPQNQPKQGLESNPPALVESGPKHIQQIQFELTIQYNVSIQGKLCDALVSVTTDLSVDKVVIKVTALGRPDATFELNQLKMVNLIEGLLYQVTASAYVGDKLVATSRQTVLKKELKKEKEAKE